MNNAFYVILKEFSEMMELNTEFIDISNIIMIAIVVMAFELCFLGRRTFRVIAGFMSFFIFALLSMVIMKNASPGEKATAYAVLGVIIVAVTIRWYSLSAFLLAGMIGYSIMTTFCDILWLNIVVAALMGVGVNVIPVYGIIVITSFWGAFMMVFEVNKLLKLGYENGVLVVAGSLLFIAGLAVQYLTNKRLIDMPLKKRRQEVFR